MWGETNGLEPLSPSSGSESLLHRHADTLLTAAQTLLLSSVLEITWQPGQNVAEILLDLSHVAVWFKRPEKAFGKGEAKRGRFSETVP